MATDVAAGAGKLPFLFSFFFLANGAQKQVVSVYCKTLGGSKKVAELICKANSGEKTRWLLRGECEENSWVIETNCKESPDVMVYQVSSSVVAIEVDEECAPNIIDSLMARYGFENIKWLTYK
jgi:hypothetical protein